MREVPLNNRVLVNNINLTLKDSDAPSEAGSTKGITVLSPSSLSASTTEGKTAAIGRHISESPPSAPNPPKSAFIAQRGGQESLTRQIEKAIDRRNLRQIAAHVKQAESESVKFKTLDTSANPVTKLTLQFFVKKEDIPQEGQIIRKDLQEQFLSQFQLFSRNPDNSELLPIIKNGMRDIQEILNSGNSEQLSETDRSELLNKINSLKELMTDLDDVDAINKGFNFYNPLSASQAASS